MARLVLLTTAWAATAKGNAPAVAVAVPGPAVIRQEVVLGQGASAGGLGAALLAGVVVGAWLRGLRR